MQMGLIGLGKMGGNMRDRLRQAGHTIVGYDTNPELSDVKDLAELASKLDDQPKVVWVMVPDKVVDQVIDELAGVLGDGDVIIDGGNSKWTHDGPRAEKLAKQGIDYLDCGVSGGVWGIKNGYALMVGGKDEVVAKVQPIFDSLKPAGDYGFVHAGDHGAGHFAKMVHNGIEYAIMQAYAEGWELLEAAGHVTSVRETFNSWREGSVIKSWLLDLAVAALDSDEHLDKIRGYAADSGEGRWTVEAGIELGVPLPTITDALYARFVSQQEDSPAMKMVAAMRNQFGGHAVQEVAAPGQPPQPPVAGGTA
ncbi:6-phosphogluconate dehydrogenase [Propionibacteriaceae bacterium ES.041]|uniref:6-phosphogluconate dehydrogenase (Decarboxylating) n=1 Tax=Enemella evansiae TaxID=2016499 RepID=A0A255GNK4_9ACTN|nr:decarboxylating 6-phosphogluconate dehydrogenase [Enemella evansiae]PFG69286.1 6-phosphogluconate dehydrogenase [Propionibacteriaceae bacterium ES.041]OYO02968.1 6-phosphogluconate dehydrogenase (decarboxylating) [Enemella evansiae]OYO14181.1 6-phosphogluconate dehydrogenase (decarboxylating) [Enemella evansiae]OYO17379.1 6-phosphogluconate dehydrogenase (decarboxylating) [Enemella evansiae]TDO91925.1 6-phosphogluconate dehydrogenase (decarboxylating) [Enemella evansiae]